MTPSAVFVVRNGSYYTGLSDTTSPYDGMLIYQDRSDRRPIIVKQPAADNRGFTGHVYAKWAPVLLAGTGTIEATFTAGTMKIISNNELTITPPALLPPALDVFIVE